MKKNLIILALIFLMSACSQDSSDDGGQGADFDESLYYTKTEIDQTINQLVVEHMNSNVQPDIQEMTGSGWDKRTVTGWQPSTKAAYVMLRILVSNTTGSTQRLPICFATAEDGMGDYCFDQNVPETVNQYQYVTYQYLMGIPSVTEDQTFYAWYDDSQDDAVAAGSFPSGFSVKVLPIWINTKSGN